MVEVEVLYDGRNMLGEGPLWLADIRQLWWVDILENRVFGYDFASETIRHFTFERPVTLLVETESADTLLIGLQGGIAYMDTRSGALRELLPLESGKTNNRTNDGGCDPMGRLWIGTMDKNLKAGAGHLYVLDDGMFTPRIKNTTIANGLTWSIDGKTMYFIDSPLKTVRAYTFSPDDAVLAPIGDAIRIPDELGSPDGMAIDEEGMLWVAHYGGFSVGRWNPGNGELIEKINVPAPHVTACTFGGEEMDTLFITTARQEMEDQQLERFPLSGSLFQVRTQVRGLPKHRFSASSCGLHVDKTS